MEKLMSLQQYVKQVKPRNESYVPPIDKVQNFLHESVSELPQEKQIDVDSLVSAETSTVATEMYEAAAVIVGMEGLKLTGQKLTKVMGNSEFSPIAKEWIKDFLKTHSNQEALDAFLNWVVLIGGAIVDVHRAGFKDFIHKNIKQYYDNSPSTFQVPTGEKPNTADVVFVTDGSGSTVINTFKKISKLSDKDQSSRVETTKKGLVTLLDEKGKEVVSFYQISLKKAFEKARIGRATTFINKNYAGGVSLGSPTQAAAAAQELQSEEFEFMMNEGFFSDAISKFKDVISGTFKNFVSWVKKKYTKVAQILVGVAVKFSNQMIKRDRGMKTISSVISTGGLNESSLTSFLGEKKSPNITVTKTLLKEFETIKTEFIKKDKINKIHNDNVALLNILLLAVKFPQY